jgi:RNA polymerase sigma-70 factor, ECF subfamily
VRPETAPGSAAEAALPIERPPAWPRSKAADDRAGTGQAFEQAVAPHYAPLVRRLAVVLGDQAEAQDVAQEAYLQAFRSWAGFDGVDVRAWLYTIGLRLAFNELRRRRRQLAAIGRLRPRPWHDTVDPDLAAAIGSLEPRARAAFLLNVVDGYTQPEIAAMLSVPVGTVASWISRARGRLREVVDPDRDVPSA